MKKSGNKSKISNKGFLVILSAPSGCGKTTVVSWLLKRHPEWGRSISVTTRPPRPEEKNGKDYEFVSAPQFQSLRRKGEFLEWAEIFGYSYGTRKKTIEEEVGTGKIVLLAIDIQGARNLRKLLRQKIPFVSIFILPPSVSVLRERLEKRDTDSVDEIERRIERAQEEIKAAKEYDATVINRDLDQTVHEIEALILNFKKKLSSEDDPRLTKATGQRLKAVN